MQFGAEPVYYLMKVFGYQIGFSEGNAGKVPCNIACLVIKGKRVASAYPIPHLGYKC